MLKEGDQIITKHEEKANAIFEFYSNLIGTESERGSTINLNELNIPSYDLDSLEAPYLTI